MASDSPSSKSYSADPALYIYTSLTAGSSHIVTATSRLETIMRANKVPFKAIDIATDEKARMLWGRRAGKDESGRMRKLPGLVQSGMVLGDLVEIEEWNEYGELKQHVTLYYDEFTQPPISQKPKTPPAKKPAVAPPPPAPAPASKRTEVQEQSKGVTATTAEAVAKVTMPIRSIAEEAAAKAKQVHLQSLRDKVYGKCGDASSKDDPKAEEEVEEEEEEEEEADGRDKDDKPIAAATTDGAALSKKPSQITTADSAPVSASDASLSTIRTAPGLQSPTTGAWKDSGSAVEVLHTLQSPTTTTWKPTNVEAPLTTYHGSRLSTASLQEIEAIERAQTIEEKPEEEEEEAAEDGDEKK